MFIILDGDYSFSSVDFSGELVANILFGYWVYWDFFLNAIADPLEKAELATLINGEIDILFELIKLSKFIYLEFI